MSPVLALLALFVVIAAIVGHFAHEEHISGKRGETLVADLLSGLPRDEYAVLNNVMLPTVDGTTTQIDHIVVSRFGIFVVETKDYNGWIFGSEKQSTWTQTFHVGWGNSEKFHFQNPIRQNMRHIYTLMNLLKFPKHYFKNVVVFCGDGEFKTDRPGNVVYDSGLMDYIRSFDKPVINDAVLSKIVKAIQMWEGSLSEERREAHIGNLQRTHNSVLMVNMASKGDLKCPKCGATMVLRHRKSDGCAFYGCSQYPNCRGIRNLT